MTDKITRPPKDNVFRAVYPGLELRSEEQEGGDERPILSGHFARFGEWTEIDSVWEGRFLERLDPGAFKKTITENRNGMRVLFQHGQDPQVGDKPLGPIRELREDEDGVYYEVPLLDTSYNRDLEPGLRAGLYGASFRFSVVKEEFDSKPKRSDYNPDGLPERTIKEARVMEFGPVTFPAYAGATAGVRSITDDMFFDQIAKDPDRLRALMERRGDIEQPERATALPADGADERHSDEGSRSEPVSHGTGEGTITVQPDPPPVAAANPPQDPPKRGSSATTEIPKMNLEELRSRQDEIQARFQEIHTEHGVNRLPDDVKTEWDALKEERSDIEARINDYEERTALLRDLSEKPQNTEHVTVRNTRTSASASRVPKNIYALEEYRNLSSNDTEMSQAIRDGARKAVEVAVFAHDRADEGQNKEQIERLLAQDESGHFARHILATGSPVYQRAFAKVVAGKQLTTEEQRAIATVGTTTTGGYNVPFTLDPTLILTSDGSVNPLRQMARVERLTQGNTWKGVTTAGVTLTRGPAELQPVTPKEVTFGQPEVTVQPVKAEIQFSIEADEDWPRLQTELARILQEAKDDEEAESFVNGVGTTVYPEGVAYGLDASSDVGTTGDGLDVSDIYRLEGALPPKYRARAQFLANKSIYASIRQFSVGATGEGSVWQRGLAAGDPAQLLGYPAREISTMESDPTADGERVMLFGDFKAGFLIVDKVGMTIEIDPHVRDGNGKWIGARALLAHYRNSSKVINDNALRALVIGVVTS
jgi:HK97 family phage major capsid protein/HK97 family phage prohead protease